MSESLRSSNVPGQFLGYSLQTTECLRQLLLEAPGATVSVEVIDDVGVTEADGTSKAIQTKSALASNPISDHSIEWWKAIASWVRYTKDHPEQTGTVKFVLHVFSPKSGHFAETFSAASTDEAALTALKETKRAMWGEAPDYPLRDEIAIGMKPYLDYVFTQDESIVCAVIKQFDLTFGSGCSRDDIKQLILTKFVPDQFVDHVVDKCVGWVKNRIETAIQCGSPPAISVSEFLRETTAFLAKLQFASLLNDFAGDPSPTDVAGHDLKTYVAQLRIIDADEEIILTAINCYLRAATNRSKWAELFLVHVDSFDDYEKALLAFWQNTRTQQNLDYSGEPSEKRGLRLLLECLSHRRRLEGKDAPDDFTPGSFHALSDIQQLGWHPDYKAKLNERAGTWDS